MIVVHVEGVSWSDAWSMTPAERELIARTVAEKAEREREALERAKSSSRPAPFEPPLPQQG